MPFKSKSQMKAAHKMSNGKMMLDAEMKTKTKEMKQMIKARHPKMKV